MRREMEEEQNRNYNQTSHLNTTATLEYTDYRQHSVHVSHYDTVS